MIEPLDIADPRIVIAAPARNIVKRTTFPSHRLSIETLLSRVDMRHEQRIALACVFTDCDQDLSLRAQ
jgi:hypothetical protein